jgi:hypothetical protein
LRSDNWKSIAEFVGIAAIVLSLVMVSYELRQSTAVATAQAIFDVNTIFDESYRARAQNPDLDELVEKGHSNPEALSERERSQFRAWLRADMNVAEATWFYQDRGIIPEEGFDGFMEAICSRVESPGGTKYWEKEARFFAAGFRQSVDKRCF